jgi:hypothetical protein
MGLKKFGLDVNPKTRRITTVVESFYNLIDCKDHESDLEDSYNEEWRVENVLCYHEVGRLGWDFSVSSWSERDFEMSSCF